MLRKILCIILIILSIAVYISGNILVREVENSLPEIDYTIYDVSDRSHNNEIIEPVIGKILSVYQADNKEYTTYKYYKKLNLVAFCPCANCSLEWVWPEPLQYRQLKEGVTIAANPNTLTVGDYVKIYKDNYIVYFTDERIPKDTIYVYVHTHSTINETWCSGIYDVYKAIK